MILKYQEIGQIYITPHSQTTEGTPVMSGIIGGVQAKIKTVYLNAQFVHELNLIIEKSVSKNKTVQKCLPIYKLFLSFPQDRLNVQRFENDSVKEDFSCPTD